MGYKCGNCGIEFCSKAAIVEHMIKSHASPFIEGDPTMLKISDKILREGIADTDKTLSVKAQGMLDTVLKARGED